MLAEENGQTGSLHQAMTGPELAGHCSRLGQLLVSELGLVLRRWATMPVTGMGR